MKVHKIVAGCIRNWGIPTCPDVIKPMVESYYLTTEATIFFKGICEKNGTIEIEPECFPEQKFTLSVAKF